MRFWRTLVLAGLGLVALTACQPPPPEPPPTTPPPTTLPPPPTVTTSLTPTATGTRAAPNAPPRIASFAVSPRGVDSPACGGQTPPRPVVTVRVIDPDDPPSTVRVRLNYHLNERYQGEVNMTYSAGTYRHTLPTLTAKHVRIGEGGNISFQLYVTDPSNTGLLPELMAQTVTVSICLGTVSNGPA